MDRRAMVEAAEATIRRQDVGDEEGIVARFAEDVVFNMPVVSTPLRGRAALRENVKAWPKSSTETEWIAIDGNRLVLAWSWRGEGFPEAMPSLRGVSTFVFNEDGLIQEYEDWFDPDWATRRSRSLDPTLTRAGLGAQSGTRSV